MYSKVSRLDALVHSTSCCSAVSRNHTGSILPADVSSRHRVPTQSLWGECILPCALCVNEISRSSPKQKLVGRFYDGSPCNQTRPGGSYCACRPGRVSYVCCADSTGMSVSEWMQAWGSPHQRPSWSPNTPCKLAGIRSAPRPPVASSQGCAARAASPKPGAGERQGHVAPRTALSGSGVVKRETCFSS